MALTPFKLLSLWLWTPLRHDMVNCPQDQSGTGMTMGCFKRAWTRVTNANPWCVWATQSIDACLNPCKALTHLKNAYALITGTANSVPGDKNAQMSNMEPHCWRDRNTRANSCSCCTCCTRKEYGSVYRLTTVLQNLQELQNMWPMLQSYCSAIAWLYWLTLCLFP